MDSSIAPPKPTQRGPLAGLKVIDASSMVMVPSASVVMADFGADVIKVEPLAGDLNRRGHLIPGMPLHEEEYCFIADNRSKRSIAIDLKTDAGLEVLKRLLTDADVFYTNTRTAALERMGLDFDTLHALNSRLIVAHGTGYGDGGAECNKPGFDAVCYWSRSGIESTIFPMEGELGAIPYGSGDHPSGMTLLTGVLMAVLQRQQTGKGTRVSTSLLANGAWANAITIQARLLNAEFLERRPRDNPRNFAAVYYKAGCGRPFKFTIIDHASTWPRFCAAIKHPELITDPKYATVEARQKVMADIVRLADSEFAKHDLDHWVTVFEANDIAFSILPTFDEIASDRQMAETEVFMDIDHPRMGTHRTVNNPIQIRDAERPNPRPAPELGQHTRELLVELGYPGSQITDLFNSQAVG